MDFQDNSQKEFLEKSQKELLGESWNEFLEISEGIPVGSLEEIPEEIEYKSNPVKSFGEIYRRISYATRGVISEENTEGNLEGTMRATSEVTRGGVLEGVPGGILEGINGGIQSEISDRKFAWNNSWMIFWKKKTGRNSLRNLKGSSRRITGGTPGRIL